MNPNDAQAALADVQRNQERTREEYVRHLFARPYMLLTALGLFVALASSDLPSPWDTVVFLLGEGILIGTVLLQRRRAAVRRKTSVRETLFIVAGCVALLVAYSAFNIAAALGVLSFGLPAPRVFAAAAIALLFLAVAGPSRHIYESLVRAQLMETGFDEFLHVPARLSIVALLAPADWVEFAFVRDNLGTSDSALSKQITALANVGYVEVRKGRDGGVRRTHIRLTPGGREAFARHAAALEQIVAAARHAPAREEAS